MQHIPLPAKIKEFQFDKERKTRNEWERYLQKQVKALQKSVRQEERDEIINTYDLFGPMLSRRTEAILNYMPMIYERYQHLSELIPNALGEEWIGLTTALCSYSHAEGQSHILYAAAIWILDHIDVYEAYPFLPKSELELEEVYGPDIWDAQYEDELILSVQYVLENRNGPHEDNGQGYGRVITNAAAARGVPLDEKSYANFRGLLSLIPQEYISHAVEQFESIFWQWADQYFERLKDICAETDQFRRKYDDLRREFNSLIDELSIAVKEAEKEERDNKKAKKQVPLMVLAQQPSQQFPFQNRPLAAEPMISVRHRIAGIAEKMVTVQEKLDIAIEDLDKNSDKEEAYIHTQVRPGGGTRLPLDGIDPYEMCFALIYLIDTGSDLPWLYGPTLMVIEQVTERLPWGIIEYDEEDDDVWWSDEMPFTGKPTQQADWYERKYQRKDDFFPRSLVQLLYEETGCLMPRNLHLYDRRAKTLGRYGVRGKDAQMLLLCMTALSTASHQRRAINLFPSEQESQADETSTESDEERELKNEIKRLKAALHDSEKLARKTQQDLEAAKSQSARDIGELADLRELVFRGIQEDELSTEEEQKLSFPCSVVKETVVFGGHDSWLKAIKPLLKGNIRFIDRELVFDTSIIRNANVLWIQTNAISHKQYYRIIDTARQFKIPVRYFSYASATKCAAQLIENDA